MNQGTGSEGTDALRQRIDEAIAEASLSSAARTRKLLLWGVRQVMLCALAWYFWEMTWMRWVFWIGVVVALIHLLMILLLPNFLRAQRRRAQRVDDLLRSTATREEPEQ